MKVRLVKICDKILEDYVSCQKDTERVEKMREIHRNLVEEQNKVLVKYPKHTITETEIHFEFNFEEFHEFVEFYHKDVCDGDYPIITSEDDGWLIERT